MCIQCSLSIKHTKKQRESIVQGSIKARIRLDSNVPENNRLGSSGRLLFRPIEQG